MVRKTSAAGLVGASSVASTSFTHSSAPSTPAGRARRARQFRPEVGVESSGSLLGDALGRSWCVSRCPLSTSASEPLHAPELLHGGVVVVHVRNIDSPTPQSSHRTGACSVYFRVAWGGSKEPNTQRAIWPHEERERTVPERAPAPGARRANPLHSASLEQHSHRLGMLAGGVGMRSRGVGVPAAGVGMRSG